MKAYTGNLVSHTWMEMIENANMVTRKAAHVRAIFRMSKVYELLTEDDGIPPLRDFLVFAHETRMDVRLLRERTAGLGPDLLAEV